MSYLDHNPSIFDVIIVMGAAVWQGGQPSPTLRRRVSHAVNLMKKGKADFLLVTGGVGKYPPAEAIVMKNLSIAEGIPPKKIIIEGEGTSTFQSVLKCVRILHKHSWSNVLVVSDSYHIFRAIFAFRCFDIQAVGSAVSGSRQASPFWKWCYYYIREIIALLWYMLLILVEKIKRLDRNL